MLNKVYKLVYATLILSIASGMVPWSVEALSLFGKKDKPAADIPVQVQADQLEYVKKENKMVGKGNVVVTYENMRMTCDYAEVYSDTKKAIANGHVILRNGKQQLVGDEGWYDFSNKQGSFPEGQFVDYPFYGSGTSLDQVSADKIVIKDAVVTTCDKQQALRHNPHYDIKASTVTIYPDDKIVARNVRIRMLGKPVMWLPILQVPLRDGEPPFDVQPGYSSKNGFYALNSKKYGITKGVTGKAHVDYRSKRGVGLGNDIMYDSGVVGSGIVKTYVIDDKNSPNQKFSDPYDNLHNDTRYRMSWKHRKDIGRTVVLAEYNKMSDPYLLKDFFQREYQSETDPETYASVTHNWDHFGIFANVEKRVNHFYNTTEKLPEVRFNWNNQEIANSNIFYKNESSVINFNKRLAHQEYDEDVVRLDTFHEVSYPKKISIVSSRPFFNVRENYYSKNISGEEQLSRTVLGGGLESNTKFYRTWDVKSNLLGLNINKLRHIIEPNIRYDLTRLRSVPPSQLFQMDSIDAIDDITKIKMGFDNRFQTKRKYRTDGEDTVNLVSYNTYMTYEWGARFPGLNNEIHEGGTLTYWENEVEFRPYQWLTNRVTANYDIPNNQMHSVKLDSEFYVSRAHLYIQEQFEKEGSKILTLDGGYQINDLWEVGGYVRTEFDERDLIEEWEIRARRDLHCWLLDLGYNVRNSDLDSSNKEVFMQLTLKAFPEVPLKSGDRSTYSRAHIGHTVAGTDNAPHLNDELVSYEASR